MKFVKITSHEKRAVTIVYDSNNITMDYTPPANES